MKLNKLYAYLLLLLVILFSCGVSTIEGMDNKLEKNTEGGQRNEPYDNRYILKSQVVPPVCPACPQTTGCPKTKACQPCAPCARCPEPSFDCKKVPNYDTIGSNALPMAYLTSFSAF
jgi:hypothetical protein